MVKKIFQQTGQSVVEYLLLLSVVLTIMITIINSDVFQGLLGPESQVFDLLRKTIEYTYQHGRFNSTGTKNYGSYSSENHDTYYDGSNSRFFSPRDAYPSP